MEDKNIVFLKKNTENRIKMAPDLLKEFYSAIRNEFLSYNGVIQKLLVNFDTYKINKKVIGKVAMTSKMLKLYLPLDVTKYDESSTHQTFEGDKKAYEDTPFMVKVNSKLGLKRALSLINDVMLINELQKNSEYTPVNFTLLYPYVQNGEFESSSKTKKDNKEMTEKKPRKKREKKIEEEVITPFKEVIEEKPLEVEIPIKKEEVENKPKKVIISKKSTKPLKAVITLQIINQFYDDEVISLKTLKEKKLISERATSLKVIGNDILDKPYVVEANSFSKAALLEVNKLGKGIIL